MGETVIYQWIFDVNDVVPRPSIFLKGPLVVGGRDEVGVFSGRLEASADALCEGLELIVVLLYECLFN